MIASGGRIPNRKVLMVKDVIWSFSENVLIWNRLAWVPMRPSENGLHQNDRAILS